MGSMQLTVFVFVFACVRLSDARFLGEREPNTWAIQVDVEPEREPSGESTQQAKQIQTEVEPFSWVFPKDPVDRVKKPPVKFEVQQPATPNRVAVRCGESTVRVEVNQDLLGQGRLIRPEDLTLGGCSATEVDDLSHVLSFNYELHSCGSALTMKENSFVYAFMLVYNPKVSGRSDTVITRSQSAVIGVECHYQA